jgi:hypothetical protein
LGTGLALVCAAQAQKESARASAIKPRTLGAKFPDKPTVAPSFTIPVDALGFAAPGVLYLGMRYTFVSLDFLSEDQVLFTFRVPSLQRREAGSEDSRQIKAVLLALPTGTIVAQARWTIHDHARYLWMLNDGHFLVRDRNSLLEGDSSLTLKPYLKYPGPLITLDLDPAQRFLITNSNEPATVVASAGNADSQVSDDSDATANSETAAGIVLRIVNRASTKIMLATRVRSPISLATNSDGYLGALRGKSDRWTIELNAFTGPGEKPMGEIESSCVPQLEFAGEKLVLANSCTDNGNNYLTVLTTDGQTLWRDLFPEQTVWPITRMAPNGLRFARENLAASHAVATFAPLTSEEIKGQLVRIFDAVTGEVVLEAPANPVLDGGGNVAISPSGRRVALLAANGIQIFDLPSPPPLPTAVPNAVSRP